MNLASHVEQCIPGDVRRLLVALSRRAGEGGSHAYLVGGTVRDLLLSRPNYDLDVVIDGDAVAVAKSVAADEQIELVAHHGFRTGKLMCGSFMIDVATARRETYERPGALPRVEPGDMRDDLFRRDFTINAMAVSLHPEDYGELVDLYGGKADLDRRYIRVLHGNSFVDDATRMFRAVRYEQRLGFELEPTTESLLRQSIHMLGTISADRTRHELELVLREECPERILARLGELGVLHELYPGLMGDGWIARKFDQGRRRDVSTPLPLLYLSLVVYHLPLDAGEGFVQRLNLPRGEAQILRDVLRLKGALAHLDVPGVKRSDIYYLLEGYQSGAIEANAIASDWPHVREKLDLFLGELRHVKTCLNGSDLQALGFPPGPRLGRTLEALHRAKLDGSVRTRSDEEHLALSLKELGDRPFRSD